MLLAYFEDIFYILNIFQSRQSSSMLMVSGVVSHDWTPCDLLNCLSLTHIYVNIATLGSILDSQLS